MIQPTLTQYFRDMAPDTENTTKTVPRPFVSCRVLQTFAHLSERGQQIPTQCDAEKLVVFMGTRKPLYYYHLKYMKTGCGETMDGSRYINEFNQ